MNSVIEYFASTYTYTRPTAGSYVDGRWVEAAPETAVEFRASIQPTSGRELMLLPEGQRAKDNVTIYTETELQVAKPEQSIKGDRVTYAGRTWEVQKAYAWNLNDYPHFKFLAQLVEPD